MLELRHTYKMWTRSPQSPELPSVTQVERAVRLLSHIFVAGTDEQADPF